MPDAGRTTKQTVDEIHQLIQRAVSAGGRFSRSTTVMIGVFARIGWGVTVMASFGRCATSYGGTSESGLEPEGSPKNWRCITVERLSNVMLRRGRWRTAPNHSRPQTCIMVPEADVEDQPEGEPQNGQHSSRRSS
jgi:hypothetical protein